MDIVGGVLLADGTEAKVVTGLDDHSRYCVIATVVRRATGRAVCAAFAAALVSFGVPGEVLTDNGKQFTGRFTNRARVRCCSSGSAGRTASWPATPSPDRQPPRGKLSASIRVWRVSA